ncbi:MAG TPA: hypothetical protein VGN97_06110 [Mesorhizobium sp.]|jgi:hypothetical protein|nr:hypothetical protein [Mesorhizobium sp.]
MDSQSNADSRKSLDYQAELLGQLEAMARADGFDSLAYLIGMARDEAAELLRSRPRRNPGGQGGGKPETAPPG